MGRRAGGRARSVDQTKFIRAAVIRSRFVTFDPGPVPGGGGNPFAPGGGGGPNPFGPGPGIPGGGGGTPLDDLCNVLPSDLAKDICEVVTDFIPLPGGGGGGGGGGNGNPLAPTGPCPAGTIKVLDKCVSPGDLFPGGDPGVFPAGQTPTVGGFGLPAFTPRLEQRTVRVCGPGMVLGADNLCYPKGVLPPRSNLRKYKRPPKPPISVSDMKAIRKAAAAQKRVKKLAGDVGFSCAPKGRRRAK